MIQVAPDVSRQRMNKIAQASPRTSPAPLSDAVPAAVTWPPYTGNTDWMALANPLKLVMAVDGSTIRMPMTGRAYSSTLATPERVMANGTSRCGLVISSPALFGSSKPANAPAVGSHLPALNDMMAATIEDQTNSRATMYHTAVDRLLPLLKKTSTAPMQEIVS